MENSVHEEPVKTNIPDGIGERVWKRVVRQLDSPEVVEKWDQAILRIAREARPEYTESQLKEVAERWHLLARGMGVAASTVDIAIVGIFTAKGVDTIAGIKRFSPIDSATTPKLFEHMAGGQSPLSQRRKDALQQIVAGSPLFALAGAAVAFRPARLGLSLAGKVAGAGGERVTRIVNAITHRGGSTESQFPVNQDAVFYGTGSARQAES